MIFDGLFLTPHGKEEEAALALRHSANSSPALALAHHASRTGADRFADTMKPLIEKLQRENLSLRGIAAELNRRSILTARGSQWQARQVANILSRTG